MKTDKYPRLSADERAEIASCLISLIDSGSEGADDYDDRMSFLADKVQGIKRGCGE